MIKSRLCEGLNETIWLKYYIWKTHLLSIVKQNYSRNRFVDSQLKEGYVHGNLCLQNYFQFFHIVMYSLRIMLFRYFIWQSNFVSVIWLFLLVCQKTLLFFIIVIKMLMYLSSVGFLVQNNTLLLPDFLIRKNLTKREYYIFSSLDV